MYELQVPLQLVPGQPHDHPGVRMSCARIAAHVFKMHARLSGAHSRNAAVIIVLAVLNMKHYALIIVLHPQAVLSPNAGKHVHVVFS